MALKLTLPMMPPVPPLLRALHWLPVVYRIVFKISLLTFKAIHKLARLTFPNLYL